MILVYSFFYCFMLVVDLVVFVVWVCEVVKGLGGVVLVVDEGLSVVIVGDVEVVYVFEVEL